MFKRPHRAILFGQERGPRTTAPSGVDAGAVTGIRPGVHVLTHEWTQLHRDGRIRTRAEAVARRATNPRAAFALQTAAALHELPVYGARAERVDVIVPGAHTRRNSLDVVRHHLPLPEDDVEMVDGLRATVLDRTVYDVIRVERLEAAVVCFDAALRKVAWDTGTNTYDRVKAEGFRQLVAARIERNAGARGIRQARFVAEFADGRAQLPGESISRLWMWQLGLPAPELQHRVDFPDGTYVLLDFAWPHLRRWAEFDGEAKYSDPEMLAGRTPDEVRTAQQRRQNKVRSFTGWHCDRWGFAQMPGLAEFAAHLRSIGLLR